MPKLISENPLMLKDASEGLKADRGVVLEAVKQNGEDF